MTRLEDINLEQLLEFEKKNKVLSFYDFQHTINFKKNKLLDRFYHFTKGKYSDVIITSLCNDYDKYRKSLSIYKTIYTLYNQLLDDLVVEIMNSSIEKDPLSLSILLGNYLIPLGFLSYTPIFHCTSSEKLFSEDEGYAYLGYIEGGFIFAGYGCCRHVVSFASDVLHKIRVPNDKITCITATKEEILSNILENSSPNHAIMGYEMGGKYYLADIINKRYYLPIKKEYVENDLQEIIILDYTKTYLLQPTLYWNPNLEYATVTEEIVNEKKYKVAMAFHLKEDERFNNLNKNILNFIKN